MKKILAGLLLISLFGIAPVSAAANQVYLGGDTVAIQGNYQGVMISGMYDFKVNEQWISPASSSELEIGDKIIAIENQSVNDLDSLYQYLAAHPKQNAEYTVTIIRNQTTMNKKMMVYYLEEEKLFKTGLYVKDKIKGIGTVTFYNPVNQSYGALGHEIMETDLGKIAEISAGNLFLASVSSVNRSLPNEPGEKNCVNTMTKIGNVLKNNAFGLYGHYYLLDPSKKLIPVGSQLTTHKGEAVIYTVLEGQTIQAVQIMITQVTLQDHADIKGIQFEIIDQAALSKTGGIIQGMSGSPIVQDGKLVGAVTHMITSTPSKGYGIFAEWMIQQSEQLN